MNPNPQRIALSQNAISYARLFFVGLKQHLADTP